MTLQRLAANKGPLGSAGFTNIEVAQKNLVRILSAGISYDSGHVVMCSPQGRALLSRLQELKAKGVQLKISSGMIDSSELSALDKHSQLSLPLHYTFCVTVFKHAAAKLRLLS